MVCCHCQVLCVVHNSELYVLYFYVPGNIDLLILAFLQIQVMPYAMMLGWL